MSDEQVEQRRQALRQIADADERTPTPEPVTEAGRALVAAHYPKYDRPRFARKVAAIEAEAVADEERRIEAEASKLDDPETQAAIRQVLDERHHRPHGCQFCEARASVASDTEALRAAAHLMLDELGAYERNWRTSSTGWTPINTAKHALRAALAEPGR